LAHCLAEPPVFSRGASVCLYRFRTCNAPDVVPTENLVVVAVQRLARFALREPTRYDAASQMPN